MRRETQHQRRDIGTRRVPQRRGLSSAFRRGPKCCQVTADVVYRPYRNSVWFEIKRDATRRDEIRIQVVLAVPYPHRAHNTAQRDHQFLQQAIRPTTSEQGALGALEEVSRNSVDKRGDDMRGRMRGQAARGPNHAEIGPGLRQQATAIHNTG